MGGWWHKMGEQYDLCTSEFEKLSGDEKAKFVHREKMKTVQQVRKDKLKAQTAYMRKIKSYKIRARESHQDVTRMKMNLKLQKLDRMVCDYVLICHYSFPCARLHVGVRW